MAAAIAGRVAVKVVRTPKRFLAQAAREFEEHKKVLGAVIAEDLERMRVAMGSAPDTPATATALSRTRERYVVATERAASAFTRAPRRMAWHGSSEPEILPWRAVHLRIGPT